MEHQYPHGLKTDILAQFLRECEKIVQSWSGEYQIIVKEYEIIIKFIHYTTSNASLDIHVNSFLSNIR